jgi:aerobic-type carbon monoxide dehydrogenase small subunit (CoxS/CutS family)
LDNSFAQSNALSSAFCDFLLAERDASFPDNNPSHFEPGANKEASLISFTVNGKPVSVQDPPSTPLLWVIRDSLNLTGTKYGCGMAQCGACTVHIDGQAVRSCVAPVSRAEGKKVTTIEGISPDLTHPLQRAWIEIDVPQCGYCQSGQIMSAAVLLAEKSSPTDEDIDEAMSGNICRCGTYPRIRRAIHRAAEIKAQQGAK